MNMYDIITKKKHGETLTEDEIRFAVNGFTDGSIPDYQMSALLMAICLKGMNDAETAAMTFAMRDSGSIADLSGIPGLKADKHSTGGVGDKVSLLVGPMVAALGVPVAKMSGRGLGHTGGTIDKLESIPGFSVTLSNEQFMENVRNVGLAIVGQSDDLAPADKKMYALRDVTATVDSIPLIAASIMSKKLASGSDVIVLDVTMGSGAFMKTLPEAIKLAETMVKIGEASGKKVYAVITDMNQVLGTYVGNALEVREAVYALKGDIADDLRRTCLTIAGLMLLGCKKAESLEKAMDALEEVLNDGRAYRSFLAFVAAQGGDVRYIENPELLPKAACRRVVKAEEDGYLLSVNAETIGRSSVILGAGREKKGDPIDMAAGIENYAKVGRRFNTGDELCVFYTDREESLDAAEALYRSALSFGALPVCEPTTIYGIVDENGFTPYKYNK